MFKIIVCKLRENPKANDISRYSSVLGNPFVMSNESQRDKVCDQYEVYFYNKINSGNVEFNDELKKLLEIAKTRDLLLGCFCAPKRCHGDTIKRYLESLLIN